MERVIEGKVYRILLPKLKCVYFYLPKVACTSIRKILANGEGIKYYPNWYTKNGKYLQTKFKKITTENAVKLHDHFKFAFVRNPLDRLVSCYFDKVVGTRSMPNSRFVQNGVYTGFIRRYGKGVRFNKMSFVDFVSFVCSLTDNESDGHFRSQVSLLSDSVSYLDYVGKFEDINAGMKFVCEKLGVKGKLEHLWSSSRGKYLDYYNALCIEKVKTRYENDLRSFNYE